MTNNVIDLESYKKIGRNQTCLCGSGKKYKHCCYNKEIQFTLDDDVKVVLEIDDTSLDGAKRYLRQTPSSAYTCKDFDVLGVQLHELGYKELAIKFLKKSLEKDPKYYLSWLNLAAIYNGSGQNEKSLEFIDKVPDGFKRKIIIKANTLNNLEGFEKVAHLYEKAVREEPDFHLAYIKLAWGNKLGSETSNYWVNLGFKNIPGDAELGFLWAREKFFRKEYEVLVSDKRIGKLKNQYEDQSGMLGGRTDFNKYLSSTKSLQEIAFMFLNDDVSLLKKASVSINDMHSETQCNSAIQCLTFAVNQGETDYIEVFHKNVCEQCQSRYEINEMQFMSLRSDRKYVEAKAKGRQILEGNIVKDDNFYLEYLSLLDDMEESEETFSIGSELESKITSIYGKARYFWDMGWYSAKLGEWKVCNLFMSKFSELDFEELYNDPYMDKKFPNDFQGIFNDQIFWCDYNIILSLIAQKKFEQALEKMNSRTKQKIKYLTSDSSGVSQIEISSTFLDLIKKCQINSNNEFYLNYFQDQVDKTDYISEWGGKIKPLNDELSVEKVLMFLQSKNLSDQIHGQRILQREELKEHSDFSDIVNSLEKIIPQIRLMPDSAFSSILEAEKRIQDEKRSFDSAPTILAYTKSLELTLRHIVFVNFRNYFVRLSESDTLVEEAKADKKFNQFRGLINFLKDGRIELGVMHQSMILCKGKTAKRVKILGLLQNYIQYSFQKLLEETTIAELGELISNYRNEATHERSFDKQELEFVRSKIIELLNMILCLRVV